MNNNTLPSLVLRCLGTLEVTLDTAAVVSFPTDKTRALLIYLAVESAQPHRRAMLADLLWPEMSATSALTNLRLTLHRLRQTLDALRPGASDRLLIRTRHSLQLNPALVTVDAVDFQTYLASCASHTHSDLANCAPCLTFMSQAVASYHGLFLAGFGLADAAPFEEWLLMRREALQQQALVALSTLVSVYEQFGNDQQAHLYANYQLALDPCREAAHRQVMRILARRGLYREALDQFEACRRLLDEEMGVAPDAETVGLYEQIRKQAQATPRTETAQWQAAQWQETAPIPDDLPPATHAPSLVDWSEAPEVTKLYGRQSEMAQLERWLVDERCRVVAVLGIGGVGKTMLVAATVKAVANHFDLVLWHSLVNAPPLDELLRRILQRTAQQHLADLPTGQDAQLTLLIECLRGQRCLLVLDNLETLLQAEAPGQMNPGYTGYAQLLQMVMEHSHQSCLVLTSRERPRGVARWEEDTPLVRLLALEGLTPAAGQAMLLARGLAGPMADARAMVEHYSGNPLALKLVTQTVLDLFAGDITAFLAADTLIFDDIHAVLRQQFIRLSPLEQEIIIWLAIEREPVPVQNLRQNLVQPGSPRVFIEALRALQRRSLIGQSAEGFLLQNVVLEYTTEYLVEQVVQEIETNRVWEAQDGSYADGAPSQSLPHSYTMLNTYALLKATAKEYVRASQTRLILRPIAERLIARLGKTGLVAQLNAILAMLRDQPAPGPGYAAGNLLNLLLHLEVDLRGYDFSNLVVWQVYLQGRLLPEVNFRKANLAHAVFTHVFGEIRTVQFGKDRDLLIAGIAAGKLCLWRAADGQLLHEYQSFGAGANIANFSPALPDGHAGALLLASGHTDHQVRLWDVQGTLGRDGLLHTLDHPETPWSLVFSPDGTLLACGNRDGAIYLWDVQHGSLCAILRAHKTAVPALAFTPDSQRLASGDVNGEIYLWQVGALEPLYALHGHCDEVHVLLFDAAGTRLFSGSHDHTIRLWDLQDTRGDAPRSHTLDAHTHVVRGLALSPDGHTLASCGGDTFVCLWDIGDPDKTVQLRRHLSQAGPAVFLSFSPAASELPPRLVTTAADLTVTIWDVARGQRIETLQVFQNQFFSVDISPDDRLLAGGGTDGSVRFWDRSATRDQATQARQQSMQTGHGYRHWIRALAFSPQQIHANGSLCTILASAGNDQTIRFWDLPSGRHLYSLHGHADDIESIHFGPHTGTRLVSASRDQTVRVWDVQLSNNTNRPSDRLSVSQPVQPTVRLLYTLCGHTDRVYSCAFSPDERLVATGSMDRTVRLWDVGETGKGRLLHTLTEHTNGIRCVVFNPAGTRLVSSGYDQRVLVWDVETGDALYTLPTQDTTVLTMAFHPDGDLLAMGLNDYTIRICEVASGCERARLSGHTSIVECVRFSSDGQWLASAGADETIRRWDLDAALAGRDAILQIVRAEGPYAGMQISGVTGISPAQKAALRLLGAIDESIDE